MDTLENRSNWLQAPSFLAVLILVGLAAVYFGIGFAALLILLTSVTYINFGLGLGLLLLIVSVDTTRPIWGDIYVSFSELETGVVVASWLARWARSPQENRTRLVWQPLIWSAPYLIVVLLSGLINEPWYKAVPHVVRSSEPFLLLFASVQILRTEERRRHLGLAIGAATLLYAGLGFWSLIHYSGPALQRVSSTFSNPNQFSGYLNLLFPFILVFYIFERRQQRHIIWGTLGLVIATSLLMTGSRSALFATLIATGTLIWIKRRCEKQPSEMDLGSHDQNSAPFFKLTPRLLGLLLVGLLTFSGLIYWRGLGPASLERALSRWTAPYQSENLRSSLAARATLVHAGYLIWSENPLLGVGPGNYPRALANHKELIEETRRPEIERKINERVRNPRLRPERLRRGLARSWELAQAHAHNLPLQVAVEFGLLGLLSFLLLAAALFRHFGSRVCRSPWSLAVFTLLIGVLVHNLADVTFPSLGLEMAILIGLGWSGGEPKP